ncbi:MAG: DUF3990 domain-containing protein [Defluviitaleaceae bacterium]|nr:DUF3990 domain-containing protein [Defluviitaleaceae bacterium]
MELYHGTTGIIRETDLTMGRHRTDFGQGFYLGTSLDVAQSWAKSRAAFSGKPVVMKYSLDNAVFCDEKLNPLIFEEPSLEWLDFVKENRRRGEPANKLRHTHGIVRGPIANDKVNFVVEDYINGKLSAQDAVLRLKALPNVLQVSLHSPAVFKYVDVAVQYSEMLSPGNWSEWVAIA